VGREKEGKGGSRNKSQSIASEGGAGGRTWEGHGKEVGRKEIVITTMQWPVQ